MAQRPGIPNVDQSLPYGLTSFLGPVKENIERLNGIHSWQDTAVTLGMLVQLGIITQIQAQAMARNL